MNDLLKQSALAYQELLSYRYCFSLGLKNELYHVNVEFPIIAYHHLAGFHKVGFKQLENKSKALNVVLNGGITLEAFAVAGYHLEDRWSGICHLKDMLEDNRAVFRYRGHERPASEINADYLLFDEQTIFFIASDCPASIFEQKNQHYEIGCPRLKTLQIMPENINENTWLEIYKSPSYIER